MLGLIFLAVLVILAFIVMLLWRRTKEKSIYGKGIQKVEEFECSSVSKKAIDGSISGNDVYDCVKSEEK